MMENSLSLLFESDEILETGGLKSLSQIIDWGLVDIAAPTLWTKTKGENINIMVIDTGISRHIDLNNNIRWDLSKSFVPNEDIYDITGHGTRVTGIIAAKDNEYGIIGIAPKSKIISVKVISKNNFDIQHSLEQALNYAVQIKPDVINISLGGPHRLARNSEILIQELYQMNIPIVCALGNFGEKYSCFPANYPETFGVTSYNKNKLISDFSSRGDGADFAFPGEDILTTDLNNKYAIVKGTSFAAPFLSGLLGLIISIWKKNNKIYTVKDLKNFLIKNVIDAGPSGKDQMYGYGLINSKILKNIF